MRKTKDCCHVRRILKGLGDSESMHAGFKDELKELLLGEEYSGGVLLPRILVLGRNTLVGLMKYAECTKTGSLRR